MKNKQTKIFTLAALLALANACKKDPIPEPAPAPNPVPTDTVTPITPVDTITPIVPGDTITPTPGDTIVPEPPVPGGDTIVPEPPVPMDTVSFFINLKNNNIQLLYPCHCVSLEAKIELAKQMKINEVGVGLELDI